MHLMIKEIKKKFLNQTHKSEKNISEFVTL